MPCPKCAMNPMPQKNQYSAVPIVPHTIPPVPCDFKPQCRRSVHVDRNAAFPDILYPFFIDNSGGGCVPALTGTACRAPTNIDFGVAGCTSGSWCAPCCCLNRDSQDYGIYVIVNLNPENP